MSQIVTRWCPVMLCALTLVVGRSQAAEVEPTAPRTLVVAPQRISDVTTEHRLLPADYQLENRNAAVILLRMIHEENHYINQVAPKFSDLLEQPFPDPTLAETIAFDSFYGQLRRAAYCSRAEWEYPLDSEPLALILLPDAQTVREFAGRGLALWIRTKIAAGEYDAAREGILVGLANARHYARTPLLVNQLVSLAIANLMVDEVERLTTQPGAPNLYWGLATMPRPFFQLTPVFQWESRMLTQSVPGLMKELPQSGDVAGWKTLHSELQLARRQLALDDAAARLDPARVAEAIREARASWPRLSAQSAEEVASMSDEEVAIRMLLWANRHFGARIESAVGLAPPQAIRMLVEIDGDLREWRDRFGVLGDPLVDNFGATQWYARLQGIDRRFAVLATIEAIRDYAGRHDGKLPDRLDQLVDTPAIIDPISGRPLVYAVDGNRFTLQAEDVAGLSQLAPVVSPVYEVTLGQREAD